MEHTESAGGIVLNSIGEIALVKNGPAFWGFPKGHLDPGEDAITAARREIAEEIGVSDLHLIRRLDSYERYKGLPDGGDDHSEMKTIHMFLFTSRANELVASDPSNPEARWFSAEKALRTLTHQKDREYLSSQRGFIAP